MLLVLLFLSKARRTECKSTDSLSPRPKRLIKKRALQGAREGGEGGGGREQSDKVAAGRRTGMVRGPWDGFFLAEGRSNPAQPGQPKIGVRCEI